MAIACASAQRTTAEPRGTLRFGGEPKDALVEVDEVSLGTLQLFAQTGILLKPGRHNVVVRKEGYFPEYRLVEIEPQAVVVLTVQLRPIPE